MPPIRAINRRDLIKNFKRLGFTGPYSGKRHQFMQRDSLKVYIPNPHEGNISVPLLLKLLKQADISKEEWESLSPAIGVSSAHLRAIADSQAQTLILAFSNLSGCNDRIRVLVYS
jgi:hypothetical protein